MASSNATHYAVYDDIAKDKEVLSCLSDFT